MKNIKLLKNLFLIIISFYFLFHFAAPAIFYWWKGYVGLYNPAIIDYDAMKMGFSVNFLTAILAIILIWKTPWKFQSEPKWKEVNSIFFLFLAVLFTIGVWLTNKSFFESVRNINTRHDYWVLGEMFFNLDFYILFAATSSFNFIVESSLFYMIIKILAGSRSAPLVLLHLGACSWISPSFVKYKKKFIIYLIIPFLLGIFGYNFATKLREKTSSKLSGKISDSMSINSGILYKLMGRISYLESSMLPIHYKNLNDEQSLSIFKEKYSLKNQMKIFINNIVLGNIFKFDVYPNQYYRAAFMGQSLGQVAEIYNSMNLTLPIYLFMNWGFTFGIIFSAIIIWSYFFITATAFRVHPLFGVCFLAALYPGLLTFFDFVMLGKGIVVSLISAVLFLLISKLKFPRFKS